ncbi:MAG: hypothetical protein M3Z64_01140, partial [Verrucomicrobiota bacterium]|nr:hypothetical protein [Verrucomicrobiota bacterium]
MSFIRTGLREIGLKVRRQKTRLALRRQRRILQRSEVALGREGVEQAGNFPELRNEIVALKKLEQEQKEVAARISRIEEGLEQIETQRKQNSTEQNAAIEALEGERKPILQRRDEAKAATEICDRELASVEQRLQNNDAADRALLEKLSQLHTQVPPPADLAAQSEAINAERTRLPNERSEVMHARLGSAEACRAAREKLIEQEAQLQQIDKKIAAVRADFEARDRALNENSRAQQDALKEARGVHQTVEERKNPAYLNIGRHLATQGITPPNAPHLLTEVQKHRSAVDRHAEHTAELAVLSSEIDKQELRKFYFSIVSVLVLLGIVLPLVWQSPQKREWLPQETEAIMSLNTDEIERDDLPKRWRKDQPDEWQRIWAGLAGSAQQTPELNVARDAVRITRAITTASGGKTREFVLVEARGDLARVLHGVETDKAFERRPISGLPVWERSDFSLARVGPKTLAVGAAPEVEELVRVRLGIKQDLKTTGQLFDSFQALHQQSAVRLISRDPEKLPQLFRPIFAHDLLERAQLLGL